MSKFQTSITRRTMVKGMGACAGASAMAALLAGCGASQETQSDATPVATSSDGKTFIYAIPADPMVFPNPMTSADRYGLMTLKLVYSPLWQYNADGVNYFLADSYEISDDYTTLTVHLKQNVKWNDGEPFTADDVVFTFDTVMTDPTANQYTNLVTDAGKTVVTKVDDYTVTIAFPTAAANVDELVSGFFMLPKHLYEGVTDFENNDVNEKGVGTGPFKLEEYKTGQYLRFSANKDYFLGAPQIDEVVFQIITNENTTMQSIQAGSINAMVALPPQIQEMNIEGNGLTVHPYSEGRVGFMAINCARVKDENVRKAILFSFDKKAIADAAMLSDEYYELVYTFLPPENEFTVTDGVEKFDRDVEKSKQLLAEAGVANPTFTLAYDSGNSASEAEAVLMQEQAAEAGITLEIQSIDPNALYDIATDPDNDYDMYFGGYVMGIDPSTFYPEFGIGQKWNYMHFDESFQYLEDLWAQGNAETDHDKRKDIYAELQKQIQETGSFYPLFENKRLLVTTQNVKDIDKAKLVPVYTFEDMSKLSMD
jgi:peptide/nickel transport system substrate-binding protein